jgi:hypothetical protein
MKKFIVVLLFVLLSSFAYAGGGDAPQRFTKTYETSRGVITFNHLEHSNKRQSCNACHDWVGQFTDVGINKDVGHKVCKVCHKKANLDAGNKAAPTICTGCHVKSK